ncbi:MAG: hypothetical protein K2O01_03970, partial [Bacteroidales bacterium]|nr:hypothetical protein [Bacteroidales bacterium]
MKKTMSCVLRAERVFAAAAVFLLLSVGCMRSGQMEKKAVGLIQAYERVIAPLDKGVAMAEYEAAQGGSPYVYDRLCALKEERALALSEPERFRTVARWQEEKTFADPYLSRQVGHIYYNTLLCQADTAMLRRMARLETYLYE